MTEPITDNTQPQIAQESKKVRLGTAITVVAVVSTVFASGAFYAGTLLSPAPASATPQVALFTPNNALNVASTVLSGDEATTISAIKKVQPAVVSIVIKKSVSSLNQQRNNNFFFIDPFTGKRLEIDPEDSPSSDNSTQQREVGGGTGFIISGDGYIITNRHVVSDTNASYSVFMNDGTEYQAKLLDTDPLNDLGVLKIEGNNLPSVELGDSSRLEIGQTAIAIGNSLNEYRQTVSKGIISGLNRTIVASDRTGRNRESLDGVIQTDAAINPGNSGGPLIDLNGQVIGINTAIDQSGQSIGFALPINDAKFIVDSLKTSGKIVRPQLGVRYMMLTPAIAKANNINVQNGALVLRGDTQDDLAVIPGSPADKAGIVENDIILEINGQKLDEKNTLAKVIQKFKPGETVTLKVSHRGEVKDYSLTLTEQSPRN